MEKSWQFSVGLVPKGSAEATKNARCRFALGNCPNVSTRRKFVSCKRFLPSRRKTSLIDVAITSNLTYGALPGNVRLRRGEGGVPRPSIVNVALPGFGWVGRFDWLPTAHPLGTARTGGCAPGGLVDPEPAVPEPAHPRQPGAGGPYRRGTGRRWWGRPPAVEPRRG
jgi:hypothetical protein